MLRVSGLITELARLSGRDSAIIERAARAGMKAGLVTTGARGRHAPFATFDDATALIAWLASDVLAQDAPEAMTEMRKLVFGGGNSLSDALAEHDKETGEQIRHSPIAGLPPVIWENTDTNAPPARLWDLISNIIEWSYSCRITGESASDYVHEGSRLEIGSDFWFAEIHLYFPNFYDDGTVDVSIQYERNPDEWMKDSERTDLKRSEYIDLRSNLEFPARYLMRKKIEISIAALIAIGEAFAPKE
ncbi:MAG: hypothetical protein KDA49_06025 [Rhodospirillaceae bacterium]|nr:hypothetical protein [Rhodospirillaceae bacterium]